MQHFIEFIYYWTFQDGTTPLYIAAQNNRKAVCQALLEFGADPNRQEKVCLSQLSLCCFFNL